MTAGRPWWLLLLPLVLPPLVLMSHRSLSGLGRFRKWLAIGLRATSRPLIILALAEVQTVQKNDKLTTIFVVDVSESIPQDMRRNVLQFVTEEGRKRRKNDLAGVVVFGRTASVEAPPAPTEPNLTLGIESPINIQYTDLAAAMKLALATFPEDSARRIVLITDGNENRGNVLEQAAAAARLGVQVDVLPIDPISTARKSSSRRSPSPRREEGEMGQHQRRDPRLATIEGGRVASLPERFPTTAGTHPRATRTPSAITLERGERLHPLRQLITETNFYTFLAEFVPEKGFTRRPAVDQQKCRRRLHVCPRYARRSS